MKRVVFLAAAAATLVQFTKYDLTALQTLGCEIHMVCNMQEGNISQAALQEYNQMFPQLHWHDLPFSDSAGAVRRNHAAYEKLVPLLKELQPDLLHCRGTIAGWYGRRAAQELHIPQEATVLLSVGTLRMQKRLRVVMQAMTRLRTQEQLHYVICGEGPDMVFLQKLTEKLHLEERVHLLGYRTDIPDLLGAADIFCMPSRREGCGMAALEAMAAGLPLITVRNHGTKVYAEKGESAFCLKGDLVTGCADAIAQLAENKLLRRQMGAHNRAAATAFSDKDRMMQLRAYYQEVLP